MFRSHQFFLCVGFCHAVNCNRPWLSHLAWNVARKTGSVTFKSLRHKIKGRLRRMWEFFLFITTFKKFNLGGRGWGGQAGKKYSDQDHSLLLAWRVGGFKSKSVIWRTLFSLSADLHAPIADRVVLKQACLQFTRSPQTTDRPTTAANVSCKICST